ncbi:MAG: type II secretion system protein [Desulfovibrionaceae bacterium]|nr:type II secretion system protein [Desulfovibrionaceae bacterium]
MGTYRPGKRFGCCRGRGFTLIEVVAVLILVGIMAAVAVAKFTDTNAAAVAEAEIFKSHLRYAQIRAMGDIYPWTVTVGGGSYILSTTNPSIGTPTLPGESGATHSYDGGVTSGTGTFTFNWRGQATTTPSGNTVVFTGKSGTVTVNITPETGFAQ